MVYLFGTYKHAVDSKGRVSLPKRFQKNLTDPDSTTLTVLEGFDGCLACYPTTVFQKVLSRLTQTVMEDKETRELLRYLASRGSEIETDAQGRIQLSDEQRAVAGLDREALLLGLGKRIEIWSPERFERRPHQENSSALAERVFARVESEIEFFSPETNTEVNG
jgi:MraZ protein